MTESGESSGIGAAPIYEDRAGALWLGPPGAGLAKYERAAGRWAYYRHDPHIANSKDQDSVLSIAEDQRGNLWVGTDGGINKFDRATGRFKQYPPTPNRVRGVGQGNVYFIFVSPSGQLWASAFAGGVDKYDPTTDGFTHLTLPPLSGPGIIQQTVLSMLEESSGVLWFGTWGEGLIRYDPATGQQTPYRDDPSNPQGLHGNNVYAIYADAAGRMWIGTDGGLNLFDRRAGTFTHFTEKDGLPNNSANAILEDAKGNLWLSTNLGFSIFDPNTRSFRNYDAADGLQWNRYNPRVAVKSRSGELFFGNDSGFTYFDPARITPSTFIPPVVLTAVRIFERPVELAHDPAALTGIDLSWRDSVVSFEFAALDFTRPEKNQYAYKLEGFDRDWNYSGARRVATYTNLPGGNYVLRVKATDSDGVWKENGLAVNVSVTTAPWKAWWAWTLYLAALTVLGLVLYSQRMRQLYARLEQERVVAERCDRWTG